MKKSTHNFNTTLVHIKYFLLCGSLVLVVLSVARLFELNAGMTGALVLTIIPLLITAGFWMYLTKKVFAKRS